MPVINFSKVESKDFEPLPVGTYRMEVTAASIETPKSGDSNTPMLKVELTIPPDDAFGGRKVFDNMSFGEAALWKMLNLYKALGISEDELRSDDGFEVEPDDLVGQELMVKLTQKESPGYGVQNKVTSYSAV